MLGRAAVNGLHPQHYHAPLGLPVRTEGQGWSTFCPCTEKQFCKTCTNSMSISKPVPIACRRDVGTLAVRGVSDVGYAPVNGNSSTGGWFGILGGTHEKRLWFIHVTAVKNSLWFTLKDCNRVLEHTRFLLLTRSTSAEDCCSRIERGGERLQSVPPTLPASHFLFHFLFPNY